MSNPILNIVTQFGVTAPRTTSIYAMTRLQKQAARLFLDEKMNKENTTPSTVLFQTLNWQTFEENVNYKQALMI